MRMSDRCVDGDKDDVEYNVVQYRDDDEFV